MKKILHILLTASLLMTICFSFKTVKAEVNSEADTFPIKSISIEKPNITMPDTNVAYVTFKSAPSTLERLHITYGNYNTEYHSAYFSKCVVTKNLLIYSCPITIPKYETSGNWKIYNIDIKYKDNENSSWFSRDENPNLIKWPTFKVSNKNEDSVAPVLKSFQVIGDVLQPGVAFQLEAYAEDQKSGIKDIAVSFIDKKTEQSFLLEKLKYVGNNKWTSNTTLPKDIKPGGWYISLVNIRDNAGNTYVRFFDKNGYTERSRTIRDEVKTATVKTDDIEDFYVLPQSKVLSKSLTTVKMQSYSNRTIEIYKGTKLLKKSNTTASGKSNLTFTKQSKNSQLKAVIKTKAGKVSETVKITLPNK